jgi:hypothetical protein
MNNFGRGAARIRVQEKGLNNPNDVTVCLPNSFLRPPGPDDGGFFVVTDRAGSAVTESKTALAINIAEQGLHEGSPVAVFLFRKWAAQSARAYRRL